MVDSQVRSMPVSLDVVIPVFNEEEVLPTLFERVFQVFNGKARELYGLSSVRFIFVDDGSRDKSAELIQKFLTKGPHGLLIRLSRNFGHQNAIHAGLEATSAQVVSVMDADLQDPPEVILEMIKVWRHGNDVIYGVRRKRKENLFLRFSYWFFYRLLALLSDTKVPVDSGDFCVMDKSVVQALMKMPEKLRFTRVLRSWVGFRQAPFEYDRGTRAAGASKYALKTLYKLATDGIASSSVRPLQLVQMFTFAFASILGVASIICVFQSVLYVQPSRSETLFLMGYGMMTLSGFVMFFSMYILCGYVGRMYLEIKHRPSYLVIETVNAPKMSSYATKEVEKETRPENEYDPTDRIPFEQNTTTLC